MSGKALLDVRSVSKTFGYGFLGREKFKAVEEVCLTLPDKPEIFTIVGESGSGKTTLAKMILGFLRPNEGSITYMNRDINKLEPKELGWFRREVQAIFENPYETFNPMKRVETCLYETVKNLVGIKGENEVSERVEEALEFVGLSLEDIEGKYPAEFSGGQLQKISMARALLPSPRLIVADEPVSMIDASMRMNIINTLKESKETRGTSLIYITHDLASAHYISDRIMLMYRGMVVEQGYADDVVMNQYHPYTKALINSHPSRQQKERWLDESDTNSCQTITKEFPALGCKYAAACPSKLDKCNKERPLPFTLKDANVACWLYENAACENALDSGTSSIKGA